MPYNNITKTVKGKKKFCSVAKDTGKTYCSDSPEKRKKLQKLHEMFKHIGGK